MTNAGIDGNFKPTLIAVSSTDSKTIVPLYADPITHRLLVDSAAGGSGTVTSVTSADANATVATSTTTPVITIVSAPKLQTARTIAGVSFDGTANISLNTNAITNGAGYTTNTGTVTSLSVASANGFAGTVATATTTPAITLSTSITGILKGNGTAISAATVGTDYSVGTGSLATGLIKSTTSTGALSIAINSDLPAMSATVGGAVPTPPNDTTKFLSGAGTWLVPSGGSGMAIGGSITSATAGSLLFAGAAGVMAQDNPNAFYDYTNHRLGLGITTPGNTLDVRNGGNYQIRIGKTAAEYFEIGHPFNKVEAPAFLDKVLLAMGPEFAVALGLALRKLQ